MDVSVSTQLEFQQSFETVELPQIQFLDRLPDCANCAENRRFHRCSVLRPTFPMNMQRQTPAVHLSSPHCKTVQKTVDCPQVQFFCVVVDIREVPQILSSTRYDGLRSGFVPHLCCLFRTPSVAWCLRQSASKTSTTKQQHNNTTHHNPGWNSYYFNAPRKRCG